MFWHMYNLWNHHYNLDTEHIHHCQRFSYLCPFVIHLSPHPIYMSRKPFTGFYSTINLLAFSRILYKWNSMHSFGLVPFEIQPCYCIYQKSIPCYCCVVFHFMDEQWFVYPLTWRTIELSAFLGYNKYSHC